MVDAKLAKDLFCPMKKWKLTDTSRKVFWLKFGCPLVDSE